MSILKKASTVVNSFVDGWNGVCNSRNDCVRNDKALREHMSEDQLDKMLRDSFPASDPVSFY